jgi:hypothetical protein
MEGGIVMGYTKVKVEKGGNELRCISQEDKIVIYYMARSDNAYRFKKCKSV